MKLLPNQQGSGQLVIFVALAVIAAVSVVGYRIVKSDEAKTSTVSSSTRSVAVPKTIKSTTDLQKAGNALDNTPIESSVNPSDLDIDINAL